MKRGRPTKLTAEVQATIVAALRDGNYREVAARVAGISPSVMRQWMRLGRDGDKKYRDFLAAVLEAEQAAEMAMVSHIIRGAAQDPRHAQWWLARKFPERWGDHRRELQDLAKRLHALEKSHPVEARPAIPPPPGDGLQDGS